MQRPLDPLRFKQNRYERPNQKWVCGRAAEGRACPLGPDARGNCRATGECSPAKKGDRWFCLRSEAQGGQCAEGPLPDGVCPHLIPPCQPVPSLRRARGSLVWLAVGLTSGLLLLLFGSPLRQRWTDSGSLTSFHATSAKSCSDCHAAAESSVFTTAAFAPSPKKTLADSALCLRCHALGDHPFAAHSVAPNKLTEIAAKLQPNDSGRGPLFLRVSHTLSAPAAHSNEIACTTCHQEHHGRKFDLRRMSDAQCQTCHSVQFASFGKGHPEFSHYPYRGRTPIFFDHASHLRQHFGEMKEKAPRSCQSCHAPDPDGRFMKVKNFSATCAACHEPQIRGAGMSVPGAAFFTVPGLDVDTLAAKGISIGEWPKLADGKITPFMELLLRQTPATAQALDNLRGVDLLDLTKATPEQLAAAEQFAWSVKDLLFRLVMDGQSYLRRELPDVAPAGMELPRAALLLAQRDWMPHLLDEVTNYQHGIKPPWPAAATPSPGVAPPNEKPAKGGDDSLTGDDDLTAAASPTPKPAAGDADLLGGGDLTAATPAPKLLPNEKKSDDLTSDDLVNSSAAQSPAPTTAPSPAVAPKSAEEWVSAGGWFRPQDGFTIYYRPDGHADSFLVAWLNTAAKSVDAARGTDKVFRQFTDPQSFGVCAKCHTINSSEGVTRVQWLPTEALPPKKSFTTFRHASHLSLFGNTACGTCHSLDAKSDYAKYFSGSEEARAEREPAHFQSSFAPLSKTLCLECHQPKIVGDSCQLCHRYHAGPPGKQLAEQNPLAPLLGGK